MTQRKEITMTSKTMHCVPVSRTPAAAQTSMQVKIDFFTSMADVMFGVGDSFLSNFTGLIGNLTGFATSFSTTISNFKGGGAA
ncbi:MAG: hypothetical protein GY851_34140 [bacterium]|nr:hypothetical protein [bacterium]